MGPWQPHASPSEPASLGGPLLPTSVPSIQAHYQGSKRCQNPPSLCKGPRGEGSAHFPRRWDRLSVNADSWDPGHTWEPASGQASQGRQRVLTEARSLRTAIQGMPLKTKTQLNPLSEMFTLCTIRESSDFHLSLVSIHDSAFWSPQTFRADPKDKKEKCPQVQDTPMASKPEPFFFPQKLRVCKGNGTDMTAVPTPGPCMRANITARLQKRSTNQ